MKFLTLFFVFLSSLAFAADPMVPSLPYTQTFNCPEFVYNIGSPGQYSCNNLGFSQNPGSAGNGNYTSISTVSNFTGGSGGRGLRQWIGTQKNSSSPGMYYNFRNGGGFNAREEKELWVRLYMRYQPGFSFGSGAPDGHKLVYLEKSPSGSDSVYFEMSGSTLRVTNGLAIIRSSNFGLWNFWNLSGKNTSADGSWHCVEWHIRPETSAGAGNAQTDAWIDDVLRLSGSGFNTGSTGIPAFTMPSNNHESGTGSPIWLDVDDVAISKTGRIGCAFTGGATTTTFPSVTMTTTTFRPATTTTTTSPSATTTTLFQTGSLLFVEHFDDKNLGSRSWYDSANNWTTLNIDTVSPKGGSGSFRCNFAKGQPGCTGGTPGRHQFPPTDSLYVSFWTKYSPNYVGTQTNSGPHEFYILTNRNGVYDALAFDYLNVYLQTTMDGQNGMPEIQIQDGQMIDQDKIGVSLIGITENRAVAGCNGVGNTGGHTVGSIFGGSNCYVGGSPTSSTRWNQYIWPASQLYYFSTPGAQYKNNWHFVEVYLKLNTISGGIGRKDGIIQEWVDGNLLIDQRSVIMRTGASPNMLFDQIVLGPYLGNGSSVDQTVWYDELTVATNRP